MRSRIATSAISRPDYPLLLNPAARPLIVRWVPVQTLEGITPTIPISSIALPSGSSAFNLSSLSVSV
jgi:hypothetical protein